MNQRPGTTIPDLLGRTALVTGASDGLGWGIARSLAKARCSVIMPVRNLDKGRAARDRILLQELDLASLESVRNFAETLLAVGDPINLLINNAGVMTPPHRRTTPTDSNCNGAPTTSATSP